MKDGLWTNVRVNNIQTDTQSVKPTARKRKERNGKPGTDVPSLREKKERNKERK